MRFRYFLIALLILTAATAAAVDSDLEFGRRAVVKADPSSTGAKAYIFVSYSTASGTVMRRASLDSIFTMGGVNVPAGTSAQATDLAQPVTVGAHKGTITVDDNLTTDPVVKITDSGILFNGSPIISAPLPDSGFVATAPVHLNEPCSRGQWSTDGTKHYECVANNTWKTLTYNTDLPVITTTLAMNDAVKAFGTLPSGQINPPTTPTGADQLPYFNYSPVVASATGTVTNAHWNMYSNGASGTSKFMIFDASGVLVCQSAAITGTGTTTQLIDAALTGCNLSSSTTYLVGVCNTGDGTAYNGSYVTNSSSGPQTRRIQVACDGTSFTPGNATTISATRPIYAWGDNNASR